MRFTRKIHFAFGAAFQTLLVHGMDAVKGSIEVSDFAQVEDGVTGRERVGRGVVVEGIAEDDAFSLLRAA